MPTPPNWIHANDAHRFLEARPEWRGHIKFGTAGHVTSIDDHAREALRLFIAAIPDDQQVAQALDLDMSADDDLPRPGKIWDNAGPSLKELLAQQQSPRAPRMTAERLDHMEAAAQGVITAATFRYTSAADEDAAQQLLWMIDQERRLQKLEQAAAPIARPIPSAADSLRFT